MARLFLLLLAKPTRSPQSFTPIMAVHVECGTRSFVITPLVILKLALGQFAFTQTFTYKAINIPGATGEAERFQCGKQIAIGWEEV